MKRLEKILLDGDIQELQAYLFIQAVVMLLLGVIIGMIFMAARS